MAKRILAALVCVMAMGGGVSVRGQFVDEGKNVGPQAVPQTGDLRIPQTDARESLTRHLAQLQAERQEAAVRAGKEGADLGPLDKEIAEIRTRLATAGLPQMEAGGDPLEGLVVPAMPVFPRIVQAVPVQAPPPASTATPAAPAASSQTPVGSFFDESVEDRTARATLAKNMVSIAADGTALVKVLESLRAQGKLNMDVNWKALEASGIDRNAPVRLTLDQVSAERALKAVLMSAGGSTNSLDFTLDGGIVIVSTRDDLMSSRYQVIRVYNVNDLLAVPQNYGFPPQMALRIYENRVTNLQDMIKSVIAPDTWRDNGGQIGSMRDFDGLLVISQTRENLVQIERFLAQLRALHGRN